MGSNLEPHDSDVDIFKKSISIRYDIFENLYQYTDIDIFKYCHLANLRVVLNILTKNKQKFVCFVEGESRGCVNK